MSVTPDALGTALLTALGLDASGRYMSLRLDVEAGAVPIVELTRYVWDDDMDEMVHVFERYKVVPIEDEP